MVIGKAIHQTHVSDDFKFFVQCGDESNTMVLSSDIQGSYTNK